MITLKLSTKYIKPINISFMFFQFPKIIKIAFQSNMLSSVRGHLRLSKYNYIPAGEKDQYRI